MSNDLKSYHVFMFPFTWDYKEKNKDLSQLSIEKRKDIDMIKNLMENNDSWKRSIFKLNSDNKYNEYNYFYEEARKAIYDNGDDKGPLYFKYNIDKEATYIIHVLEKKDSFRDNSEKYIKKIYRLNIEKIALRIYDTGVAILSYHLSNLEYPNEEDILKINQYGRRIYAPFKPIDECKKKELASMIKVSIDNKIIEEEYDTFSKQENRITISSELITGLLGEKFKLISKLESNKKDQEVIISPIIDDRMFVISWYGNNLLSKKLSLYIRDKDYKLHGKINNKNTFSNGKYKYLKSDFWYKFLFVDGGFKTCQNKLMTEKLLKRHTYDRWIDCTTLFGISKYSFMLLTSDIETLRNNELTYLLDHFKHHYYQIANLLLMQRSSILSFSKEASYISKELNNNNNRNELKEIRSLHRHYIRFINRMYFREVTAQEQGIELYDILKKSMRTEKEAESLDREIDELHNYVTLVEESNRNKLLGLIAVVGALFAVPTFVATFFGMEIFKELLKNYDPGKLLNAEIYKSTHIWNWLVIYFSAPSIIGVIIWNFCFNKNRNYTKWLPIIFLLIPVFMLFILNCI